MAKTYYSEYVNHCLKFYIRHQNPRFKSNVDKQNWNACNSVIKSFNDKEQNIIFDLYRREDIVPVKVHQIAKDNNIETNRIWKLINDLERKVAKSRGLL